MNPSNLLNTLGAPKVGVHLSLVTSKCKLNPLQFMMLDTDMDMGTDLGIGDTTLHF